MDVFSLRMHGTKVTLASSKDDGAVTVPEIATSPLSEQEALILELENIPELQDVVPRLKPGHDATDAGIRQPTTSQ